MTAEISECGKYRYLLGRNDLLGGECPPFRGAAIFIMLNPSTADSRQDDPTIRRCIGFAKREGFNELIVANLYALRSPSPADLWTADNPVGPDNDEWLETVMQLSGKVICAWGANAKPDRVDAFISMARAAGKKLHCLGTTKSGAPRHPLYIKASQPLIRFAGDTP